MKAMLPDEMVRRVQYRLARRGDRSQQKTRPIDLSRIELIRGASTKDLSDPSYLEHQLLPQLGLNDELLHQIPPSLHRYAGYGLLHWQLPNQFSRYLVELSRHQIESYLEIGTRHGGTFVITSEYLSRFHPLRRAMGVDLGGSRSLGEYSDLREDVIVLRASRHSEEFRAAVRAHGPFDLVLIDGDHSAEGCRSDFEFMKDHGRVLAFHDIVSEPVPGVGEVWREVKDAHAGEFRFVEFTQQYAEQGEGFGIGVASPHDMNPDG
jgi:hypothetical protein